MKIEKNYYSMSTTKHYWCHICKTEFMKIYIEDSEVQCSICKESLCEELSEVKEGQTAPQDFIPFNTEEITHIEEETATSIDTENSSLVDLIANLMNLDYENEEIENIINYIMQNDPNRFGTPPASKEVIDKLDTYAVTNELLEKIGIENNCVVCREVFEIGSIGIDLPCRHRFHKKCLLPWLQEHNSCPVCRFELPTDDEDYEKRKHNVSMH